MEYTARYLVKVEPGANNNKWYRCEPHGETWTASWGRVGNEGQSKDYPRSQYEKKLNEKLKKGYKDQTELIQDLIVETKAEKNLGTASIADVDVRKIVEHLMAYAKAKVAESYKVTSDQTTQAQCDRAQELLNSLAENAAKLSLKEFNQKLIEVFTVIPRRMQHVQDFLADENDRKHGYERIMQREQDTLDSMKSLIKHVDKAAKSEEDEKAAGEAAPADFLKDKGLEISVCSDEDVANIKNHLGNTLRPKFKRAWRVTNVKTQKAYDRFCADNKIDKTGQKLYWHGSRNENWWSILQTGLVLRPTNAVITGKMFGYGLYMANKAMKSYGYTSGRGSCWARGNSNTAILAVMQCAEGKAYRTKHHSSEFYTYDWKKLQAAHPGCHSLFAEGGADLRNDEIIVYRQEQVTIKYLVELEG